MAVTNSVYHFRCVCRPKRVKSDNNKVEIKKNSRLASYLTTFKTVECILCIRESNCIFYIQIACIGIFSRKFYFQLTIRPQMCVSKHMVVTHIDANVLIHSEPAAVVLVLLLFSHRGDFIRRQLHCILVSSFRDLGT